MQSEYMKIRSWPIIFIEVMQEMKRNGCDLEGG